MKPQLALTRLVPPRPRSILAARPRLLRLLDPLKDCRLFLVIAPAGYGKTTLLVDWATQTPMRVCWYQLALPDQDSHRFFAHFIAALQSQLPAFGSDSAAALDSLVAGQGSAEQLLVTIVNDLVDHVREEFTIVLDDFQLVDQEDEITDFVSQFVQHAPDTWHVILSSRTLIGLPDLDLLVARGQVGGLGSEELAFRPDEIQNLALQQANRHLDFQQAAALAALTEGWITGLLLSAQAQGWQNPNQLRMLKASGVDLYSYFAQQVLMKQPPAVRDFLLRTAQMEHLDAEFCAYVFGSDRSAHGVPWSRLIDHVYHNNLFVAEIGTHVRRLRYHSLFQDFLQQQFFREAPREARTVLNRLATVYGETQQWGLAYECYRKLEDVRAQLDFLDTFGVRMPNAGQSQLLVRWVEELPYQARSERGSLMAAYGRALMLTGEPEQGIRALNLAEAILRTGNDRIARARALAYRSAAWRLTGRYQDSLQDAEQASQLIDRAEQIGVELQEISATCLRFKGLAQYMMGEVDQGVASLQLALTAFRNLGQTQETATISNDVGLAYLNAGNFNAALPILEQALQELRQLHNVAMQANVLNNLGYLHCLRGDYLAAVTVLHEALACANKSRNKRIKAFALATLADILDDIGLTDAAKATYEWAVAIAEEVHERYLILYLQLARTRVAWSYGDWESAFAFLGSAEQLVKDKDSVSEWSLYRLTIGRYYLARHKPELAIAPISDALEQFVKNGQTMDAARAQLFLAAARSHSDPAAALAILERALAAVPQAESRHLLFVIGLQVKPELERLAGLADHNKAVVRFLRDIGDFAAGLPGLGRAATELLADTLPLPAAAPPALSIHALGKPEVYRHGTLIGNADWLTLQARDMFFCLLAHPHGLSKEEIGLLFWPDCSESQLKTRFKNTMHRMRSALPADAIIFANDVYRFNARLDHEYDVVLFLGKVAEARQATDIQAKIRSLRVAFDLYHGPYLPFEEALWAVPQREMLRQVYSKAGIELSSLYLVSDQATEALSCCLKVLAADPCLEDAHRLAMQIHAALGNRAAVVSQYELCCRVLRSEIDVDPSPQTIDLFEKLIA